MEFCKYCQLPLSHASTHSELARNLIKNEILVSESASAIAFESIDKGYFIQHLFGQASLVSSDDEEHASFSGRKKQHIRVLLEKKKSRYFSDTQIPSWAYLDTPIELPVGQPQDSEEDLQNSFVQMSASFVQMSAPHVHATSLRLADEFVQKRCESKACQEIHLEVLDLGSGTGYFSVLLASLFAEIVKSHPVNSYSIFITGFERLENVQRSTHAALEDLALSKLLKAEIIEAQQKSETQAHDFCQTYRLNAGVAELTLRVRLGDGGEALNNFGDKNFDLIHCGCAAEEEVVAVWRNALRPGGRMIVPIGSPWTKQMLTVVDRESCGQKFTHTDILPVTYVPFIRGLS